MGNYYKQSNNNNSKRKQLYFSIPFILDKDGYCISFDINNYNPKQIKQFYDNFGIVVFNNVITQNQVQNTINDFWKETQKMYEHPQQKIDKNDPKTWNFIGMHQAFGFINNQPINQPQVWKNRSNPKVYKAFKNIFQLTSNKKLKEPLIACLDRGSMMRPGKINSQWLTADAYHFDIDPWFQTGVRDHSIFQHFRFNLKNYQYISFLLGEGNYEPNIGYTKLAGVLALSDTNQQSGGFQAALGFQNYIKQWCKSVEDNTNITDDEQLMKTFQKVFLRKGSLLIFSRQLPHNIYPNKSQNFRYAQYLRMIPQSALCLKPEQKQKRKKLIHPIIPKDLERTQICKQIFMLDG